MDWQQLQRQDILAIEYSSFRNPLLEGPTGAEQVISCVEAFDAGFEELSSPDVRGKYSAERLTRALQAGTGSRFRVRLSRSSTLHFALDLGFQPESAPVGLVIHGNLPLQSLIDNPERSGSIVAGMKALGGIQGTRIGFAHPAEDAALDGHDDKMTDPPLLKATHWLDLLGPELIERIGEDRVQNSPAYRVEKLPSGATVLMTRPTPVDYASPEARRAQALMLAHLDPKREYQSILKHVNAKTERLRQVERHWDPDIEPLLELIVDHEGYANRGPNTEAFNRYRPPAVTEWREEPFPSDVPDTRAAVKEYEAMFAEQLIAQVSPKERAVMDQDERALSLVDLHMRLYRYPETFARKDIEEALVPAVGGYLGKVMVHELGGRWVPRKNLEEAQVVIGTKAWLPFLRARHYLQSNASLLDYSLTQFYRFAARQGEAATP